MHINQSLEKSLEISNKDLSYSVLDVDISRKEIEEILHAAKKIIRESEDRTKCANAYIKITQCLQKVGNFKWSEHPLREALKMLPDSAEAIICKGLLFDYQKEYEKAIDSFDKTINIYYKDSKIENIAYVFYLKARTYDNEDKFDHAIYYYNKAIQLKKDYALAFLNRGLAHLKNKSFIKAREDYEEVIMLKEKFAQAYDNLAFSYYREEQNSKKAAGYETNDEIYRKAISICKKAVELKPIYPPLYHTIGLILFELNEFEESLDYFFKYLQTAKKRDVYTSTYYYIDKIVLKLGIEILWNYKGNKEIENLLRDHHQNHYNHFVKLFIFLIDNELLEDKYKNILSTVFDFWRASYQAKKDDNDRNIHPEIIYQYTTIDTLKKMFNNKALRMRPAQYQNDPEEGQALYKHIKTNTKNKLLKEMVNDLIENIKLNETEFNETIAFIRSFTSKKDDLLMWRLYGDDGLGVSIGIPTAILSKGDGFFRHEGFYAFDLFSEKYGAIEGMPIAKSGLFKVNYDSDLDFKAFSEKIIKLLEEMFKDTSLSDDKEEKHRKFIELLFLPINHIIKSDIHKHEDEYRLIYISKISESDKYIVNDNNPETGIYIETEEVLFGKHKKDNENKHINYVDIVFGPKTDTLTYLKFKHSFEHRYNKVDEDGKVFESIDVALSKAPYR